MPDGDATGIYAVSSTRIFAMFQRAPNRVKAYMAGQGNDPPDTNKHTTKFAPLAGDDRRLTLLKRGCANSVVGLELADFFRQGGSGKSL